MCLLGPAHFNVTFLPFQSCGRERMVRLLITLALRPNLSLLLGARGLDPLGSPSRASSSSFRFLRSSSSLVLRAKQGVVVMGLKYCR